MLYPVQDLRAFLAGPWRIARRIRDIQQGLTGRLTGSASFTPVPQGLTYDEAGLLRFGAYQGEAACRYLFAFDRDDAAQVRHADGSLFHPLNLSTGKDDIRHQCGEDLYLGRYRVLDRNRFVASWDVAGPRKRYRMATLYTRG
ncbi:MAG TPA: DUF6314 family protein [Rhizomicrobium sp.]